MRVRGGQASVNPKADTVEELQGRRKALHLGMHKLAQQDLALALQAEQAAYEVPPPPPLPPSLLILRSHADAPRHLDGARHILCAVGEIPPPRLGMKIRSLRGDYGIHISTCEEM